RHRDGDRAVRRAAATLAVLGAAVLIGGAFVHRSSVAQGPPPARAPVERADALYRQGRLAQRQGSARTLPTVASINLCTDQLVLHVADPEQILTLSWLSSDPEESTLADAAARYPQNY